MSDALKILTLKIQALYCNIMRNLLKLCTEHKISSKPGHRIEEWRRVLSARRPHPVAIVSRLALIKYAHHRLKERIVRLPSGLAMIIYLYNISLCVSAVGHGSLNWHNEGTSSCLLFLVPVVLAVNIAPNDSTCIWNVRLYRQYGDWLIWLNVEIFNFVVISNVKFWCAIRYILSIYLFYCENISQ